VIASPDTKTDWFWGGNHFISLLVAESNLNRKNRLVFYYLIDDILIAVWSLKELSPFLKMIKRTRGVLRELGVCTRRPWKPFGATPLSTT
jgi:hypothetical protein